jgi:hypothetical protein
VILERLDRFARALNVTVGALLALVGFALLELPDPTTGELFGTAWPYVFLLAAALSLLCAAFPTRGIWLAAGATVFTALAGRTIAVLVRFASGTAELSTGHVHLAGAFLTLSTVLYAAAWLRIIGPSIAQNGR